MNSAAGTLLGAAEIRRLADRLGLLPTKTLGQNFVHDANTVRRIAAAAHLGADDHVLEVGPGLGSLTLALLDLAATVTAVEIDPRLAGLLPETVAAHDPGRAANLTVLTADALHVRRADLPRPPTALVANLPYNVAVPVLLHLLAELGSIRRVLVMVQAEVADRLVAPPGSRTYGAPSAKLAWYGAARRAGSVSRAVFWPVPGVDSALVALDRHPSAGSALAPAVPSPPGDVVPRAPSPPGGAAPELPSPPDGPTNREAVFAVIDAAFAHRRKTLRSALAPWAGSPADAERICRAAGVDPGARGEALGVSSFVALAAARDRHPEVA